MKKLFILLVACVMFFTLLVNAYAAPTYGSEWVGYEETAISSYHDVPKNHWAYQGIERVSQKNWFGGYPDGTFRPDASITRAEALKVFVLFLGLDYQSVDISNLTYSDINPNDWYAAYVEAGKDLFPVHTTIQGKTPFNPNMPVTREDTVYALVKALGCDVDVKYPDQSVLNMFNDSSSISGAIKDEFAVALNHQLVSGFPDNTIRAQAALTRAEFATLLLRGTEHGFHDNYVAKIESVSVIPSTSVELTVGENITLSARATYTDNTTQAYGDLSPYDASGNGVISLNGTAITALKAGTATVKYDDPYLKNETLTIVVKNPTDAPKLKITDYVESTEEATATIRGNVTDKSGSVDLTCNGKDVSVNNNGSFIVSVPLTIGKNSISFAATNMYDVETIKKIEIERVVVEKEKEAEEPTIEEEKEEPVIEEEKEEPVIEEQSTYIAYDAFELKNGSTPWSFQHATIGLDDYSDLEFVESGWYHEFYQNWEYGAWPYGYIKGGKIVSGHAGFNCDPVLTFTAPRTGEIVIPSFRVEKGTESGDGVRFQILKNDKVIFPKDSAIEWYEGDRVMWELELPDIYLTVDKGDKIHFRINMKQNQNSDGLHLINYQIKYL